MQIFTIESGKVSKGAKVEKLTLKGAGISIPAILIGEEGRGRQLGVLPVQLTKGQYATWQEKGWVVIPAAEIGATKAGKPKLVANEMTSDSAKEFLVVFRTPIGFRGGNRHTGDRTGEEAYQDMGLERTRPVFAAFPGKVIVTGVIAQGDAGRMGEGDQMVAIMSKDVVFRTAYTGRLYGGPSAHYYKWDGEKILALTWEERISSELF